MTLSDPCGPYQPQISRPNMSRAPEVKLNNDYLNAPYMARLRSDSSTSSINSTFSTMDPIYPNFSTPLESMASSPSPSYTELNLSRSYASYPNSLAQWPSPAEPSYLTSPIATSFTNGSMNDNSDLWPGGYSSITPLATSSMLPGKTPPYLPSLEDGERRAYSALFNIEKDGDPAINWEMYYDFYVDKEGAYYKLQDGYLPTEKYPAKRPADPFQSSTSGELRYPCKVVQDGIPCNSKPFRRPFDLDRHFRTVHSKHLKAGEKWECDYTRCSHKDSFQRQDHCREHYREYHREDLIKRNLRGSNAQVWLKDRNVNVGWWRCSKCLKRNYLAGKKRDEMWKCECGVPTEKERVEAREKMIKKEKNKAKAKAKAEAEAEAEAEVEAGAGPELQLASAQWGCNCLGDWYEDGAGEMVACPFCEQKLSDIPGLLMGDPYPVVEDKFSGY